MLTMWTQAYNSEKYIRQCIESVLNQSYTDFEYIIVDDGSTDATWAIIEEYAHQDPRIRAFREDGNIGGVRHHLFRDHLKGQYFAMVDSDDWLEPNFLMDLFTFCTDAHLDMGVCGTRYVVESGGESGVLRKPQRKFLFRADDTPQYFSAIHPFLRPIWGKLIKTETFRNADLSVLEEFTRRHYKGFDTAFSVGVFENCQTVGMLDRCLHNYRVRTSSAFTEFSPQRYDGYDMLHEQAISLLAKHGAIGADNQRYLSLVFFNAIKDTLDIAINSPLSNAQKIAYVSDILNKPRVLELRKRDYADDGLRILTPYLLWVLDRAQG